MLNKTIAIAKDAGAIILKYYDNPKELSKKEGGSSLTEADLKANEFIVEKLRQMAPQIPIISEESAAIPYEKRKTWEKFWLVDPLDGTAEFLERNGEFTVNIALIEKGEPVLGVIYAPTTSLLYYAEKNKGAWKQEKNQAAARIYSREPDPIEKISIVASRRHGSAELARFLESLDVKETVSAGSSIKFCLVAEGKADLYPRLSPTMEWDVAAGDCIYRNSAPRGFRSTSLTYNKADLRNSSFVIGMTTDKFLENSVKVNRGSKMSDLKKYQPAVLWFTGLSGSGKSTIAEAVFRVLKEQNFAVEYLDGDMVRSAFPEIGFTRPDRERHLQQVGFLASMLEKNGILVVASFISPYEKSRRLVRDRCRKYIEIYISTPLAECERRDVKGLYAKARKSEIKNFTGVSDPYEAPASPEINIDATVIPVQQAVDMVLDYFKKNVP